MTDEPLDILDSVAAEFSFYQCYSRYLDLLVILISLPLTIPISVLISIALLVQFKGKIIFTQPRVGYLGQTFKIYKFRTILPASGAVADSEESITTRFGRFLRRHKLDELPQFINVAKGEMRLVGPRPEIPEQYNLYSEKIENYSNRKNVLPGITGLAQISQPHSNSLEGNMRKLSADLEYAETISLKADLRIAFRTLCYMLFGKIK